MITHGVARACLLQIVVSVSSRITVSSSSQPGSNLLRRFTQAHIHSQQQKAGSNAGITNPAFVEDTELGMFGKRQYNVSPGKNGKRVCS